MSELYSRKSREDYRENCIVLLLLGARKFQSFEKDTNAFFPRFVEEVECLLVDAT